MTVTETAAPVQETVRMIPVVDLVESSTNPRKTYGDLTELTDSIKQKGILQPLLVRHHDIMANFEIVFGHRRFRAATAAGLTTVPCMVRELSDQEALEAQVVENCQRSDIHPMEEAESYELLHHTHRMPVEEIAHKVGRTQAYVYHRLLLLKLQPEIRKAFAADKLTTGKALLLARIPDKKLQLEAFDQIQDSEWDHVSLTAARKTIEEGFMLRLKGAPFDPADPKLVPGAGACGSCPKRTGNQAELFSDIKSKDLCTDPTCFEKKRDAAWKQKLEAVKASGGRVIEDKKEIKKLFPHGDHSVAHSSGYADLEDGMWVQNQHKPYREILADMEYSPVLVQAPQGKRYELLPRAELTALLKKAGIQRSSGRISSGADPYAKRRAEEARIQELVQRAVLDDLQEKAEQTIATMFVALPDNSPMHGLIEVLALGVIHRAWHYTLKTVTTRRGLAKTGAGWNPGHELIQAKKGMSSAEVLALAIEVLAAGDSGASYQPGPSAMNAACALFGVNKAAIAKRVKAEEAAKKKAKQAKKKGAKKASARKGDHHPTRNKGAKKKPAEGARKKIPAKASAKKTAPKKTSTRKKTTKRSS